MSKDDTRQAAIVALEKKYGKGTIVSLGGFKIDVDVISTGSLGLDRILGVGGIPLGKIIEIFGNESCGKTTLLLTMIREAQKKGGRCLIVDVEHALDKRWANIIGVDDSMLDISQPGTAEEALDIVEYMIRTGAYSIIGVDSVAALLPKTEDEGEMGDNQVGLQARLMGKALRKLNGPVSESNVALVFINQIRYKVGVMFGNPETTSGGNALKFYASVRIELKKASDIKEGNSSTGILIRAKIIKNKVASPFQACEIPLRFGVGISRNDEIIDAALDANIISKAGAYFSFNNDRIGHGRLATLEFLASHPEVCDQIITMLSGEHIGEEIVTEGSIPKDE